MLAEVIEPRIEELYTLVQAELRRCGFRGTALVRDRAHRRLGIARGHDRTRRGGLSPAGARRRAGVRRAVSQTSSAARATRPPSGLLLEGRDQFLRAQAVARADDRNRRRRGAHEAMVQGEFLGAEMKHASGRRRTQSRSRGPRPGDDATKKSRHRQHFLQRLTGEGAHHVRNHRPGPARTAQSSRSSVSEAAAATRWST